MEEAFQVGYPFVALEVVEQMLVEHIQQELMEEVDHHIHQVHHHRPVGHQEMLEHILNGQFLGPEPEFKKKYLTFSFLFPINELIKINLVALGD